MLGLQPRAGDSAALLVGLPSSAAGLAASSQTFRRLSAGPGFHLGGQLPGALFPALHWGTIQRRLA